MAPVGSTVWLTEARKRLETRFAAHSRVVEAGQRLREHLSRREPMQFKSQEGCDAWNEFCSALDTEEKS